jgi:hypothetical protein
MYQNVMHPVDLWLSMEQTGHVLVELVGQVWVVETLTPQRLQLLYQISQYVQLLEELLGLMEQTGRVVAHKVIMELTVIKQQQSEAVQTAITVLLYMIILTQRGAVSVTQDILGVIALYQRSPLQILHLL